MDRNKLISIGKLSKLTGASVRSLRYYEKLGILIPVHISPDSRYRYYSLGQIQAVKIIMLCIELDIPLSELAMANDPKAFRAFLGQGRKAAKQKMKAIEYGMILMESVEKQLKSTDLKRVLDD